VPAVNSAQTGACEAVTRGAFGALLPSAASMLTLDLLKRSLRGDGFPPRRAQLCRFFRHFLPKCHDTLDM
jgi:hypothetical protein